LRRSRKLAERIGRHAPGGRPGARGAVFIQIDGLSHETLVRAMRLRAAPFIRKLLKKRGHVLSRYRVGLPAVTPAHNAKAFYGDGSVVPGLYWFDRAEGRPRSMGSPADARDVEARFAKPGALENGAAYGTFFQGGSHHSAFTVSGAEFGQVTTTLPAWELFAFLVANAPALARVALGAVWETVLELWDHVRAVRAGTPGGAEIPFLFERVISNTVMREMTTAAVSLDVHRGVPVIWANFPAYDVMAHHRGPTSLRAFWTLRGIDRCVRIIERAARNSPEREYDVFVLSDHGMVPTVPFEALHGSDPHTWLVREGVGSARGAAGTRPAPDILPSAQLLSVLGRLRHALPGVLARLAATVERRLKRRIRRWELRHGGGHVLTGAETSIHYCGGMAHVYLAPVGKALFRDEVDKAWPGLVGALARLDGVRAVVVRSRGGGVEVTGASGRMVARGRRGSRGAVFAEGESPLEGVVSEDHALRDLTRLLANPDSGDLVVLGGRVDGPDGGRGRGRRLRKLYLNFQNQSGAHGGLEPQEQYAFFMGPAERREEVEETNAPEDLYALLRSYGD
jgi:hypothetical protein